MISPPILKGLKKWFPPQLLVLLLFFLFFIPMCGFMFQCGCKQVWQGAHKECNYFVAGDPDCPFCAAAPGDCASCKKFEFGFQLFPPLLSYAPAVIGLALIQRKHGKKYLRDFLITLFLTAVSFVLVGFFYGNLSHYPYFFSKH